MRSDSTGLFIALAERVSGRQLDDLVDVWLFTGEKPASPDVAALRAPSDQAAEFARQWIATTSDRLERGRL